MKKSTKSKKRARLHSNEDTEALLRHSKEADITLDKTQVTSSRSNLFNKNKEGKVQKEGVLVKGENLDFADILNELESKQFKNVGENKGKGVVQEVESSVVNTTKLKKQLNNLKRDGSKVLSAPLSGYKRVKVMREQAQELNSKIVSKFVPQVKANREQQQHDFTTADKLRSGGNVNLKSLGQKAANLTQATASSEMERQI